MLDDIDMLTTAGSTASVTMDVVIGIVTEVCRMTASVVPLIKYPSTM